MERLRESSGLLIVGHGSTVNADSSAPTLAHATMIRQRDIFAEVQCAFWKEEPSLRDALFFFRDATIREVFVVPNFISEGYFTQTVIPRELELQGRVTDRADGQRWNYCEPVGNNASVTEMLLDRAREIAPKAPPRETTLLIVGHGTSLNDNSAIAAKREAEKIHALHHYATVLNVYMEEPPFVSDWAKLTNTPNVVVVPFFIADGLHSYQDIPVLLGIEKGKAPAASQRRENDELFSANPHKIGGRALHYARSLGTDARFANLIVEQAAAFSSPRQASQPES